MIALAQRLDATLHHVSSIAVAGTFRGGVFTEDDFDVAQDLPTPYHQTKFEAELLVRTVDGLRYRIYRPAVVVGDSKTGGNGQDRRPPLLLLRPTGQACDAPPQVHTDDAAGHRTHEHRSRGLRVEAITALMRLDGRDGQTFHLTAPKTIGLRGHLPRYRPPCGRLAAPPDRSLPPRAAATPVPSDDRAREDPAQHGRHAARHPPRRDSHVVDLAPTFTSERTEEALQGTGITAPEFASYAPQLWRYWAEHLDPPDRARRDDADGPLVAGT